jgi:hypothetical protein
MRVQLKAEVRTEAEVKRRSMEVGIVVVDFVWRSSDESGSIWSDH